MTPAYREYAPPARLAQLVACTWENDATDDRTQLVVPDACVDLVWMGPQELIVAGADTGPRRVAMPAGTRFAGVRLLPGAAGAVLGVPASEVRDRDVSLTDIWGEEGARLQAALAEARPADRRQLLVRAVSGRDARPDPLVREAARLLAAAPARVASVAAELGVSERQLHRRTVGAVGYAPKTLARVARLRRLVELSEPTLASRAFAAGYASQAHMNEEVRRLTGATPVRFLKDAEATAA